MTITNRLLTYVLILGSCTMLSCRDNTIGPADGDMVYKPVYLSETNKEIRSETPRALSAPGKIFYSDDYLFVSEKGAGVHVFDNTNPASPQNLGFISIPGNKDVAVQGNILYADNYIDLVALDFSDINNVNEVYRYEGVYKDNVDYTPPYSNVYFECPDKSRGPVIDWVESDVKDVKCYNGPLQGTGGGGVARNEVDFVNAGGATMDAASAGPPTANGKGGSMARFTIAHEHLYVVSNQSLNIYNIAQPSSPQFISTQAIGFNIETIFPYEDRLFIGSQGGMYIFGIENPAAPSLISVYTHINSCDPVVVEGDYAYVTLSTGSACQRGVNQLEIIDISNITSPQLIKEYPMTRPLGLGIDNNILYLCDGTEGLKVFDVTDKINIQLKQHLTGMETYDVIPYNDLLLLTSKDGIYQYDKNMPTDLKQLSHIPVNIQ